MASRSQSSSCFDRLPDEVLQRIERSLGVKDRLAFFSCCRAVRAYQTAATGGLWPELQFLLRSAKQAQALAGWLGPKRQHLVSLRLEAQFLTPNDMAQCTMAEQWQSSVEMGQAITAVLSALAGSSVRTLVVAVMDAELNVGDWVLRLPELELLAMEAAHLIVSADLSSLTRLTTLSLVMSEKLMGSVPFTAPPLGMPPHMRTLELLYFDAEAFRTCTRIAAGPLQQLQELTLCDPSNDWPSVLPYGTGCRCLQPSHHSPCTAGRT